MEGLLENGSVRGESSENGGERRPDVGAEGQRIHAVEMEDSDSYEWCESRGEDRTALYQHGETSADENRHVAGQMAEDSREVGVDELA